MKLKVDRLQNASNGFNAIHQSSSHLLTQCYFNELELFFQNAGLEQYLSRFEQEGFTHFQQLFDVTDQDLMSMGFRIAHRIQFRKALQQYQQFNRSPQKSKSKTSLGSKAAIFFASEPTASQQVMPRSVHPKKDHFQKECSNSLLCNPNANVCPGPSPCTTPASIPFNEDEIRPQRSPMTPNSIINSASDSFIRPYTSFVRSRDLQLKSPTSLEPIIPYPPCPSLTEKFAKASSTAASAGSSNLSCPATLNSTANLTSQDSSTSCYPLPSSSQLKPLSLSSLTYSTPEKSTNHIPNCHSDLIQSTIPFTESATFLKSSNSFLPINSNSAISDTGCSPNHCCELKSNSRLPPLSEHSSLNSCFSIGDSSTKTTLPNAFTKSTYTKEISPAINTLPSSPSSALEPSLLRQMLTSTSSSNSNFLLGYFHHPPSLSSKNTTAQKSSASTHIFSPCFIGLRSSSSSPSDPVSPPLETDTACFSDNINKFGVYPDYFCSTEGSKKTFSPCTSLPILTNSIPPTSSLYSDYGSTLVSPQDQPYLQFTHYSTTPSSSTKTHSSKISNNLTGTTLNKNTIRPQSPNSISLSLSPSFSFKTSKRNRPDEDAPMSPTFFSPTPCSSTKSNSLPLTPEPKSPHCSEKPFLLPSYPIHLEHSNPPVHSTVSADPSSPYLLPYSLAHAYRSRFHRKRRSHRALALLCRNSEKLQESTSIKRPYRRHPKPDPKEPLKPFSAYMMFSNEVRQELRNQKLSFSNLAKVVGDRWKSMSSAEKKAREEHAARLKEDYQLKLMEYRQTSEFQHYLNYLHDFEASAALSGRPFIRSRKKLGPA
ncbi:hypothetical protein HMI54_004920 [Coelomomyces lativittatus]|nr:hypothetical protein HMI54_004920 [Coelomomyces lativittatus]KAJ1507272.1 hypothetical protein HMI55_000838 [Coelomomyces lativittatus]KAJ1514359.1 hypothetical protein HMI56_000608 [Coelomomyces lativittatus]